MYSPQIVEKVSDERVIVIEPIIENGEVINAWAIEYFKSHPQISANEVRPGDACTLSVGTDSYAEQVTNVFYFKSGPKAGQVKGITITGHHTSDIFYPYAIKCSGGNWNHPEGFSARCVNCNQEANGIAVFRKSKGGSYQVRVGKGEDYRDPSF
jgi:hypothetical protein